MGFDVWLELWSQALKWWSSPKLKGLPFTFFLSYLETAFPNYIICVCLAIKAARHHFVAFLYSKIYNWCSLLCLSAIECSLLDKEFVEWCSEYGGGVLRNCSTQGQNSRLCDLSDCCWLCLRNIFKQRLHNCTAFNQDFFFLATLAYSAAPLGSRSTSSLVTHVLSVDKKTSGKVKGLTRAWKEIMK